jgi:hypothetical protein
LQLPPVKLPGEQITRLSLKDLTREARGDFGSGNIQIYYRGSAMGVTAQVSVASIKERLSFESMAAEAAMFASNKLNGIVWVPDDRTQANVALTNVASSVLTITATSGVDSNKKVKPIKLEPRETLVLDLKEFFDGRKATARAALVRLEHSGAPGDLLTTGFALNEKTGFASSLTFIDPATIKSTRLAGAHLRFGKAHEREGFPAGTTFRAPLVLANVGDVPTEARVSVDYTIAATANRVDLEPLTLAAQEVRELDLAKEMARRGLPGPVENAGVDINYSSVAGSVIGRLASFDASGDLSFEVPIKDPLSGMNRVGGSYPWRLDQGYTSVLQLKNTIGETVYALIQLRYARGTYHLERLKLAPYQTVAVDIKQLRDTQQKDIRGGVMPPDLITGKVVWYEEKIGSLIGRAEVTKLDAGIASSFSCGGNCPCAPNYSSSYLYPDSLIGPPDQSGNFILYEMRSDPCDNSFGPYNRTSDAFWSSSSSSVASIQGPGSIYCDNVGTCTITAQFTAYYYEAQELCLEYPSQVSPTGSVTVATVSLAATGTQEVGKSSHYISLINTGNVTITATLSPAGTDPSVITWSGGSAGSDNLHRVVSTSSAGDTNVTASVGSQSVSVRIHVINATTPPAAAIDASKTYSNGGTVSTNGNFGRLVTLNTPEGVYYPTYGVNAYFASDRWVFRVQSISHSYKLGINSLGKIDLPNGNPASFPLAPGLNLQQSHTRARSDLDTTGLPPGQGLSRTSYWVQFITEDHKAYHIIDYYSSTYWLNYMGLFESQDVEASSVNVIFNCDDNTTTTGSAAITKKTSTWDTAMSNRHDQTFTAFSPGAETRAHNYSNPEYVPIRNAIPNP